MSCTRGLVRFYESIALIGLLGTCVSTYGQKPSQFCSDADSTHNASVLIEVTRIGRGMTWPLLPQLFFRVYKDGRIEYQVRDRRVLISKSSQIDSSAIEKFKRLLEASDLVAPRLEYPMLEGVRDALMKTCVIYAGNDRYHKVLLVNYMPDHPNAKGYYAESLVELLTLVQEVRPANKYERKYGFDKLSFR